MSCIRYSYEHSFSMEDRPFVDSTNLIGWNPSTPPNWIATISTESDMNEKTDAGSRGPGFPVIVIDVDVVRKTKRY